MNRDWISSLAVIVISVLLSTMASLYIVDKYDSEYATKVVVMDIAGSIRYLQENGKIPEGGSNEVIRNMLNAAQRFSDHGYIVLDKGALITTNEDYVYEYHGE